MKGELRPEEGGLEDYDQMRSKRAINTKKKKQKKKKKKLGSNLISFRLPSKGGKERDNKQKKKRRERMGKRLKRMKTIH